MTNRQLEDQPVERDDLGVIFGFVADVAADPENQTQAPTGQQPATIHFVYTEATLLSGGIDDCHNDTDTTCEAGVAAVNARLRAHTNNEPYTVIPILDYQSAFVQMHPVTWNVNRFVLQQLLGAKRYLVSPHFFSEDTSKDLTLLKTNELRPLISNLEPLSTNNVWSRFVDTIFFDSRTRLAVMAVDQADQQGVADISPASALLGLLEYINYENLYSGCNGTLTAFQVYQQEMYGEYTTQVQQTGQCWISVVIYSVRTGKEDFQDFVTELQQQPYPPQLILDVNGNNVEEWSKPTRLEGDIWVASYVQDTETYYQQTISVTPQGTIASISMRNESLLEIPDNIKDQNYTQDIAFLRSLADSAAENDPVVGQSLEMPFIRTDDDGFDYRKCMGGECPGGNLFSDALRWHAGADFAFISSGGIRGPGWPEGEVHVSDIFDMLPFSNTACNGTISGLNLFRVLDYSTRTATFQSTYTPTGDRLLQVSGLRYTYNTELSALNETTRLVHIEVMNQQTGEYEDVERLKLYKFATDSWLCANFEPFPSMLTTDLQIEGEQPGIVEPTLHQQIVEDYFKYLGSEKYDTSIQGRLVNDTDATVPLDWNQSPEDCGPNTQWTKSLQTCIECPDTSETITFTKRVIEFSGTSGSDETFKGTAQLRNGENYTISVQLDSSPTWLELSEESESVQEVDAGGVRSWDFTASAVSLESGTATASVPFNIRLDGSEFSACTSKASFDVYMRVSPVPQLAKPGEITATGLAFMSIAIAASLCLGIWVMIHREHRIVKALQPQFLATICIGVAVIALSIAPLSFSDDIASLEGRSRACQSTPWLLSMGFSVLCLSLYAKLWRINQLFHGQQFRRVTVTSRKVAILCLTLTFVNFLILLLWTVIDPLRWEVDSVKNEPWNQYGTCVSEDKAGSVWLALTLVFNCSVLVLACHQAYKARNISDEYSEAKHLGIALFGWVEIVLVGFPVLYLIEDDNRNAKYFLQVILITCMCLSMLLTIFVPIVLQFRAHQRSTPSMIRAKKTIKISGLEAPPNPNSQSGVTNTTSVGSDNRPENCHHSENILRTSGMGLSPLEEEQSGAKNTASVAPDNHSKKFHQSENILRTDGLGLSHFDVESLYSV